MSRLKQVILGSIHECSSFKLLYLVVWECFQIIPFKDSL